MNTETESMAVRDARHEVELVSRRLGMLHLAFARTLVNELGEEQGRKLTAKAIKAYGEMVGRGVREVIQEQGLPLTPENYEAGDARTLPMIGMHDRIEEVDVQGEKRMRSYGCVMAKVWKEYGEEELGRLYCYVDPAKFMAYNPEYKMAHVKALPDGDAYCEFCIRKTTQEERNDFASQDADWLYIDRCGDREPDGK